MNKLEAIKNQLNQMGNKPDPKDIKDVLKDLDKTKSYSNKRIEEIGITTMDTNKMVKGFLTDVADLKADVADIKTMIKGLLIKKN